MIRIPGAPNDRSREYFAVVKFAGTERMVVLKPPFSQWPLESILYHYTDEPGDYFEKDVEVAVHHFSPVDHESFRLGARWATERSATILDAKDLLRDAIRKRQEFIKGVLPAEKDVAAHSFFMGYFSNCNAKDFSTSLDFITELIGVLEHHPNNVQTVGNAIMNAGAFVQQFRPGPPFVKEGEV